MSRATIDRPYAAQHQASMGRKAVVPKNLIAWFLCEYRAETPEDIHSPGLWRDRVSQGEERNGIRPVGGSLLGSPRYEDLFRRMVEESPFQLELASYDGQRDRVPHYAFPIRAALARLAGKGRPYEERPFMARVLHRTALRDGDWQGACASLGIPEPVRRIYVEAALGHLWRLYQVEPMEERLEPAV